jgi:RHS repeat-associated protein
LIELNEFFSVSMLQPQLSGNRVVKRFYKPATTLKHTTWYARDAQGNVLSIYERLHADSAIKQTEVHIYGSSRLGIEQRNIAYSTSSFAWLESEQHRHAGTKRYELTDHLGNVRVTISDLLVPSPASSFGYATQDAEVLDRRDYYPFGMEMPGRRWRATSEDAARFGFNGKENDNEVKGEGNQQDYGFRIYDPRVARFLSVDPLEKSYPSWSPYPFAMNRVIDGVDLDGLEWKRAFDDAGHPTGFLWDPDNAWNVDQDGSKTLKSGYYLQAVHFQDLGTFVESERYNMGTSVATVHRRDGTTEQFSATTHPSRAAHSATVPEGSYEANVGSHKGDYRALRMHDIGDTQSRIELGAPNPADKSRTYAEGVNVHKPGAKNFTGQTSNGKWISAGCFLIDLDRWDEFIGEFDGASKGDTIGISVSRTPPTGTQSTDIPQGTQGVTGVSTAPTQFTPMQQDNTSVAMPIPVTPPPKP